MDMLDQALAAAATFQPMTQDQVAALLAKTRSQATAGKFERYKVSDRFDGTSHNPQWLGEPMPKPGA